MTVKLAYNRSSGSLFKISVKLMSFSEAEASPTKSLEEAPLLRLLLLFPSQVL